MKSIAGTVILYNPDIEIKNNINSYLSKLDKLYVIDNSNYENSSILPVDDRIVYIPNMENKGIARALNQAAELAIEDKFEWLLTMDQDSMFIDDNLDKLIDYVDNNDTSLVGIVSPWHAINVKSNKPSKIVEELLEVMTSGNLVNLKIYDKIKGYKNWLFIDCVDFDYCLNLNKNGYKVIRINDALLRHELGNIEIKKIFNKEFVCSNHNHIRKYYIVRNILYINKMYKDYFYDYCKYIKKTIRGSIINTILFETNKFKKLQSMYRGYCDYKKGITGKYPYE